MELEDDLIINETPDILRIKVQEGEEVRCPHWDKDRWNRETKKKGRICNYKFFNGRPSTEPQEFKCKCGKKTIFVRLD
uniref:Uncharacterized protein n=1 Tax=viral metagenome TaxID=1070528 RepID=A0A6H1ZKS5_9ZZZZ